MADNPIDRFMKPPLELVPDVMDVLLWHGPLLLTYDGGLTVDGTELTPTEVKNAPAVYYNADPDTFYLLCMTDPDAPSRADPKNREFLHWLVGNIPGKDLLAGDILAEYVGSGPPQGTGLHRYVFLVFKQPGKLEFNEPRMSNKSVAHRRGFSIRKFAQKYNLTDPIVNVYLAQFDDFVPHLHKQLGIVIK